MPLYDRLSVFKIKTIRNLQSRLQLWCDNLPLDKQAEYCNGVPRIKQRAHLREVFDQEAL